MPLKRSLVQARQKNVRQKYRRFIFLSGMFLSALSESQNTQLKLIQLNLF
jgi:hypothetical protein